MFVLSFRDMTQSARGGVTDGALYWADGVAPGYRWDPAQIGTLRKVDPIAFGQAARGAHVCFIIHGFNVDRDDGFEAGGAMTQEFSGLGPLPAMPPPDVLDLLTPTVDLFVPVLWPGDWFRWLPLNYPFELGTARAVGRYFGQFLTSATTTMRQVSFFTHSFGVRVCLEAVQNAVRPPPGAGRGRAPPAFGTALLTAAAAPDTVLDSPFYADAIAALERIVVVSAPTDEVLGHWFPLGTAVEQALWFNDPGPDVALGLDGPVLKGTSAARRKTEWFVVTDAQSGLEQLHGDYMPAPPHPERPLPNGWTGKRQRIARLAQAVLGRTAPPWAARGAIPAPFED